MNEGNSIELMGYNVFRGNLEDIELFNKKIIINTLNAYAYVVAKKDKKFKEAQQNCDILMPDGFSIVIAAKVTKKVRIRKIAGEDVFYFLLKKLEINKGSCFLLGATDKTLEKIENRMKNEYTGIKVGKYSPPFKKKFSDEDNRKMIQKINDFKPDVLFIGMTCPKQELWTWDNHKNINTKVLCSIGAVFDFYAENIKRPSPFWIKIYLEWFIRLINEPKRLWKRYLVYSPLFFFDLIRYNKKLR